MGLLAITFSIEMVLADAFPKDLTLILIFAMLLGIVCVRLLVGGKGKAKRVTGITVAVAFFVLFGTASYFLGSTYAMILRVSGGAPVETAVDGMDITSEPFNVYITGIDQWESEKGKDLERSDVNMIVTVNPETKKVLLTSIPRDAYVKLHTAQEMDKLTHTGIYGVDETLDTVSDWLGIDIDYYVKMNFTAVRDIIDAMGGVKVYSPEAFGSSVKDYKYRKGWNELNGTEALYFARERHAFVEEDAARVENQQRLMKAIISKLSSSTTLLTRYGKIMDAAGKNLTTNLSSAEMKALVKMQTSELCDWDVENQKIEGYYDMRYVASMAKTSKYSVYMTDPESVRNCVDRINSIMNPSDEEKKEAVLNRSRSFVVNLLKRQSEESGE